MGGIMAVEVGDMAGVEGSVVAQGSVVVVEMVATILAVAEGSEEETVAEEGLAEEGLAEDTVAAEETVEEEDSAGETVAAQETVAEEASAEETVAEDMVVVIILAGGIVEAGVRSCRQ